MNKFNFIILGHGAAAFAAAIRANELGIKTVMIGKNATEGTVIGGTCVNVGCLPSKRLIAIANSHYYALNNSFDGIKYEKVKIDFRKIIAQKDKIVGKFRKEKYAEVIKNLKNITYINEIGTFIDESKVRVGNEVIEGKKFLIATGAKAFIPNIIGIKDIDYLTNEEALNLKDLPKKLCVFGAGPLGLEFAQLYSHLGTEVTVLHRSGKILPEGEPEISQHLRTYLEEEGIKIITGANINFVRKKGNKKLINITYNSKQEDIECEHFLIATGRTPNVEKLGLKKIRVNTNEHGFILVNEEMQTSNPNIWAAGDVTGKPMLETLAAKEGAIAVENAFTENKKKINFNEIPKAVFTYPEVASVGLTDAEAVKQGIRCNCRVLLLENVPKAHIVGDVRGLVKIVADAKTKKILGVHILAPHAADLIHEGVLAVKNKLTIDDIIDTVHVFPTLSEAIKLAAQSFYKDVSKLSCCVE